ncbi:unnamed protein product [Oreochromis niloticus]|nr:unnamed protein product [Mustela putorius furo]
MTLLRDPPAQGKYAALKALLLRCYSLSDAEQAEKLLSLAGLGDGTALELMESMLSLLGADDGGFLFTHLFLRQLPAPVRAGLANSPLLATKDYRSLAEEADRILLATRSIGVQAIVQDSPAFSPAPLTDAPGAPRLVHGGRSRCTAAPRKRALLLSPAFWTEGTALSSALQFPDPGKRAYYSAMAADQSGDPDILALKSTQTGLILEDRPMQDGGPLLVCDVSTGRPRPVVPVSWRRQVFDSVHAFSHPGVRASVKLVSSKFVWPGLRKSVKEWASACIPCQRAKVHKHTKAPLEQFFIPGKRFDHVHVDLVGPLPQLQVPAQAPRRGRPPSLGLTDSGFPPRTAPGPPAFEPPSAFPARLHQPRSQDGPSSACSLPPRFSCSGRLLRPRVLD